MSSTEDFATKVVKDSIAEVKSEMPKELSHSIPFTASAHVYNWVVHNDKVIELIEWLKNKGFNNIQTVNKNIFTTVTATASGSSSNIPAGCNTIIVNNCSDVCSLNPEGTVVYKTKNDKHYYYNCIYEYQSETCYQSHTSCGSI